jgi:hypothetical protein
LPNSVSSSASPAAWFGIAAFSRQRVQATASRSASCGRGKRAVESQDIGKDGG